MRAVWRAALQAHRVLLTTDVLARTSTPPLDLDVAPRAVRPAIAGATVSALLVRPLAFALGCGPPGALDALYAATGLTPDLLADPDARIAPGQLRRAWDLAIELSGNPLLALELSAATPPGAFGVVEYVVRSAATIGEALALGVRYLHILDEVIHAALVDDDDDPELVCLELLVDGPIPREACFAVVVAHARILAGEFRPARVELAHRPDADPAAYARFFGAPVTFDAPRTRLVMTRGSLAAPLVTADPTLLPVLVRHADELLARRAALAGHAPVSAQVRDALCALLRTGRADAEHVAAHLGVTPRSLQRRLKDEGTTFVAVRDELRRELALGYLDDQLSIAEVSFLLGFSEASAFFRAFKRWTGMTPAEAQRRATAA